MRRISALFATVLGTLLLGVVPASAAAQTTTKKPCIPGTAGPKCHFWNAKVNFVADGDTIHVDVLGDGTRAEKSIRFTGINAMELSRYSKYPDRRRGACHGLEATALVERYIKKSRWRVRLAAQSKTAKTGHRLRRSVFVKSGGKWVDLAKIVIGEGHALWLPNPGEWAHNYEYHLLAEQAAAAQKNLWDPDYCGVGPNPEAQLDVSVNWDADGDDSKNLNGEWVDIRNFGATDVPLAGWWVRDSFLIYNANKVPGYEFPSWAVVPAGGKARLYMGCGPNGPATPSTFYWCQPTSIFENRSHDNRHTGDGAYLFDPQGDVRGHEMYPCLESCTDPLIGKVKLDVTPTGPDEKFRITNVGAEPVDLEGYIAKLHLSGRKDKFIFGYTLGRDAQLAPGETFTIHMDGSPSRDERLVKHLDRGPYVLADGGNTVSLRTTADVIVDCTSWGRASC